MSHNVSFKDPTAILGSSVFNVLHIIYNHLYCLTPLKSEPEPGSSSRDFSSINIKIPPIALFGSISLSCLAQAFLTVNV